jgi:hypothetical protein
VVGNGAEQNVIYLGDGDGSFDTTSFNFGTGSDYTNLRSTGDVNGDGYLDIVVGNGAEQNSSIWETATDPSIPPALTSAPAPILQCH